MEFGVGGAIVVSLSSMAQKVNRQIDLVRHGQTDWNVIERLQGTEDIPLNAQGEGQALGLAAVFKGQGVERVVSSGLLRAHRTAEIIARELGIGGVEVVAALHERDWGQASGLTPAQCKARFPEGIETAGVEPYAHLRERMLKAFEHIQATFAERRIVVVSHGAAINSLIAHFSDGQFGTGKTRLVNCSITSLINDGSGFTLREINLRPEDLLDATGFGRR